MPDDKKLTLDDILEEYDKRSSETENNRNAKDDNTAPADEEQTASSEAQSELSDDEEDEVNGDTDESNDSEEQDASEEFSSGPLFAPAELFESSTEKFALSDDMTDSDEINSEEDIVTTEEIFAEDAPEDEENAEVPVDLLEEEDLNAENSDNSGEVELLVDDGIGDTAMTWAENGFPNETAETAVPEGSAENTAEENSEMPDENAKEDNIPKDDEAPADNTVADSIEDVNDKWLVKAAKSLFPVKGDSIGEIIRKIIFLTALIVFIGAGIMLISTLVQSKAAQDVKDAAKSVITTTVATYIDEEGNVQTIAPTEEEVAQHNFNVAEHFKKINEDYVGYLEVEGCDIYEPVVQGDDNDKYLRTNIAGGYNKAGTVFMDYRCTVSKDYNSPNLVLYGHNQEDGTMFGNLKEYKQNVEFYREHPVVKFSTEYESGEYLIYGFFVTHIYESQDSNGEVFHYHDYIEKLNDESTFNWYINEVQKRNQIISPVDVKFGDKLLCLSTCSNEFTDSRFVVFARKLRDGESSGDYDFSSAYMNPNAMGVDWDAIITGDPTYVSTDEIGEEPTEETTEAFSTWEKSLSKNNSGSGASSDGKKFTPPAPIETSAPETTTKAKTSASTKKTSKKTETSQSESESETSDSETSDSASETSDTSESNESSSDTSAPSESEGSDTDTSAETEPPPPEEGSETETAATAA